MSLCNDGESASDASPTLSPAALAGLRRRLASAGDSWSAESARDSAFKAASGFAHSAEAHINNARQAASSLVYSAEENITSVRDAARKGAAEFVSSAEHRLEDVRKRAGEFVHNAEETACELRKKAGEFVLNAEDRLDVVRTAAFVGMKRLLAYHELPSQWQENQFILTGYRFLSSHRACLRSVLELHNETANIWTHITGLVLLVGVSVHTLLFGLPYLSAAASAAVEKAQASKFNNSYDAVVRNGPGIELYWQQQMDHVHPADSAVHLLFFLAAALCLGCSATFHTFLCHASLPVAKRAATLDYMGIAFLISASVAQIVYYGFYTSLYIKAIYMSITLVIGATGTLLPLFAWFDTKPYRPLRIILFLAQAGTGAVPVLHMFLTRGAGPTLEFTKPLLASVFFYCLGVVFYSGQLPERFRPGQFDIWGASHQIWHLCVVAGIWFHHRASLHFFEERWSYGALTVGDADACGLT